MKRLTVASVAAVAAILATGTPAAQGTAGTTGTTQGAGAAQGATPPAQVISAQKGEVIQKIIVKVNGEIFTQTELEFRQIQTIRDQNRQVRTLDDVNTEPGLRAVLSAITPGILVDAVDELIVVQHGKEGGYKFTEAQFTRSLEDLKKDNKLDDKQFMEALKQEGITLAQLRVNLERAYFVRTVQQREIMQKMTLTEEETRGYYNAHQDQFMKPATVTLREILVAVSADAKPGVSFGVTTEETAKQKIAAARDRVLKGEDFEKVVAEVSESSTKPTGLIGPIEVAALSPALTELLDKMKPGDVTEAIRTKSGYQILKLETRSSSEPETFEKSRDAIANKILEARLDVERGKFIERLLLQAVIEWKDDAFKKQYETERAIRMKRPAAKEGK